MGPMPYQSAHDEAALPNPALRRHDYICVRLYFAYGYMSTRALSALPQTYIRDSTPPALMYLILTF